MKRKQIAFDLNVAETEKYHPAHKNLNAYMDIRRFMESQGFIRTQGSVYESVEPMSIPKIQKILRTMQEELPWIKNAMTACSYTSIGIKHNGMDIIAPDTHKKGMQKNCTSNTKPRKKANGLSR